MTRESNNKNVATLLSLALTLVLGLGSCAKNDQEVLSPNVEQGERITLEGEKVRVDLLADVQEDDFRAAIYDENNKLKIGDDKGRRPKLKLESTVPVLVYLRKKDDTQNSVSVAKITGKVSGTEGSYKVQINGYLKLRQKAQSLKVGDWEVNCVLGGKTQAAVPDGDKDEQTTSSTTIGAAVNPIFYPTSAWTSTETSGSIEPTSEDAQTELQTRMPWMTGWQDLESLRTVADAEGYGRNKKLSFKPKGILLRIKPRSNMAMDLSLLNMKIQEKDNWVFCAEADMTAKASDGDAPFKRPATIKANQTYTFTPSTQSLPSGAEMSGVFYVWVMPTSKTAMDLRVTLEGYTENNEAQDIFSEAKIKAAYMMQLGYGFTTFNKEKESRNTDKRLTMVYTSRFQLPYNHGKVHTIYPVLHSDLMITEVFQRNSLDDAMVSMYPANTAGYYYTGVNLNPKPCSTWGGVEIYNPSLTEVDLSTYGLFRIKCGKLDYENGDWIAHPSGTTNNDALVQDLDFRDNNTSSYKYDGSSGGRTTRVRVVEGNITPGKTILAPGKTIIILDASYQRHTNTKTDAINQDNVRSIGIQIKKAIEKGYCQAAVSLNNAKVHNQSYTMLDEEAAVMNTDVMATYYLVKKTGSNNKYTIIEEKSGGTLGTNSPYFAGHRTAYQVARHGRDGNVRTRFVPATQNNRGNRYDHWGWSLSIEKKSAEEKLVPGQVGDYINYMCTLGTRRWLGPTEKSRENEWNKVPNFVAPQRKWTAKKQ